MHYAAGGILVTHIYILSLNKRSFKGLVACEAHLVCLPCDFVVWRTSLDQFCFRLFSLMSCCRFWCICYGIVLFGDRSSINFVLELLCIVYFCRMLYQFVRSCGDFVALVDNFVSNYW